ncbi:protein kinase domain-containing protein [Nonomuraea harbinensis]|uniref:Protein kinase n=1 Tax=Nonomuraea harbinensis TaxID=1286938 RepID=A0ABW1C5M6_9ACTN|nr:protein kinase [Nonomuraea harbinensis]
MPEFLPLREEDPTHVGPYRLIGRLGRGVYAAEGAEAGRPVVVKLLGPQVDQERFLRLVESIREVSAFCSAQVLDSGTAGGRPYVVSEYIDGPTLAAVTAGGTRLREAALHRLAVGTVTALVAIHQAGAVHGDVRPENVVLGPDGPRLINVGVAGAMADSAETTTRQVETPAFAAPERLDGAEPGPAADMFSWAATLVSAATGRSPFDGGSMAGTVNRIVGEPPDLPDLGDLRGVVEGCLDKDPARRPSSSDVLLRLVGETRFLTGELLPQAGGRDEPPARRGRGPLVAVAAFAAGALLSGAAVYTLAPPWVTTSAASSPSPGAVITSGAPITPSVTTAPVASVPPKADKDVELPDIGATLHEHPDDVARLTAYLQVSRPFKTFVRDASGRFEEVGLAEEPRVSPDGRWVALNPWLKYQNSDMDHVRFRDLSTGETFTVQTVKKPESTQVPAWSRDGRRLLLSIRTEDAKLFSGFVVVDVAARTSTVVNTQYKDAISLPFTFLPDGTIARGYSGEKSQGIETYDMSGKVTTTKHWVGMPRDRDWYSPDGRQFFTVCPKSGDVCVWDAVTGARKATVEGLDDDVRLIGWFDDDHLLIEDPGKKKGRLQVKVVDFLGRTKRVLADLDERGSNRQWAAIRR